MTSMDAVSRTHTHTHTHMHTHTHPHTKSHTYTHYANIHTRMRTPQTHTSQKKHAHTHSYTHIYSLQQPGHRLSILMKTLKECHPGPLGQLIGRKSVNLGERLDHVAIVLGVEMVDRCVESWMCSEANRKKKIGLRRAGVWGRG